MTGLYTVVLLGPNRRDRAQQIAARLLTVVGELGLATEQLAIEDATSFRPDADRPVAAVYFGGAESDAQATELAARFVNEGHTILPVVEAPGGIIGPYHEKVPRALLGVNGFPDDGGDGAIDRVANVMLAALGLVRARRRVFISYRRTESSGVALQLAPALQMAGYQIFLDVQSVERGALFQRALWDAMADTDVVVFLDTDATLDSRWVAEEFALANELGVTVLHLAWPGRDRPRTVELSDIMRLTAGDFQVMAADSAGTVSQIRAETLRRVLDRVERLRAAAFAAKRRRLIEGFVQRVHRASAEVRVEPSGRVLVKRRQGEEAVVVPVVGAVESTDLEEAAAGTGGKEIRVLYRARGMHEARVRHLRWLDQHLPVKLLELDDVRRWL